MNDRIFDKINTILHGREGSGEIVWLIFEKMKDNSIDCSLGALFVSIDIASTKGGSDAI